jgi:hypothetical protein
MSGFIDISLWITCAFPVDSRLVAGGSRRSASANGGSRQAIEVSTREEACDKSETMNTRHAAAVALVGWYLRVPPSQETPKPPIAIFGTSGWNQEKHSKETNQRGQAPLVNRFAGNSEHPHSHQRVGKRRQSRKRQPQRCV